MRTITVEFDEPICACETPDIKEIREGKDYVIGCAKCMVSVAVTALDQRMVGFSIKSRQRDIPEFTVKFDDSGNHTRKMN